MFWSHLVPAQPKRQSQVLFTKFATPLMQTSSVQMSPVQGNGHVHLFPSLDEMPPCMHLRVSHFKEPEYAGSH
jgi:hypothetical protein